MENPFPEYSVYLACDDRRMAEAVYLGRDHSQVLIRDLNSHLEVLKDRRILKMLKCFLVILIIEPVITSSPGQEIFCDR